MTTPVLQAEFQITGEGRPISSGIMGMTHYAIRIFLVGAPPDTLAVTYQLHPSYTSPVREVPKGVPDFQEQLTSYGDFDIYVTVRSVSGPVQFVTRLSGALETHYGDKADEEILNAIKDIKAH